MQWARWRVSTALGGVPRNRLLAGNTNQGRGNSGHARVVEASKGKLATTEVARVL